MFAVVAAVISSFLTFLWPVVIPAAAAVKMVAPGAGGLLISRAAFIANPKLYFAILHSGGPCLAV